MDETTKARNEETGLDGKRILVTGGTTGIGRATVALVADRRLRSESVGRLSRRRARPPRQRLRNDG